MQQSNSSLTYRQSAKYVHKSDIFNFLSLALWKAGSILPPYKTLLLNLHIFTPHLQNIFFKYVK